jgi:hypothetical protein
MSASTPESLTKTLAILARWQAHHNLRYHVASGGIYLFFHGMPIYIAFSPNIIDVGIHPSVLEGMPPFLEVQLPIDDKLVGILSDWHENMLWTHLSLGKKKQSGNNSNVRKSLASRLLGREKGKSEEKFGLFTRAELPSQLACEETLYHVLVEVTGGYWSLLKTLSDNGLLNSMILENSSDSLKKYEKVISELVEPRLSIKPYRPDELQSLISSLHQENTKLAFCDRSEPPPKDLPRIPGMNVGWGGNFFLRQFKSEHIQDTIMPIRECLERLEKEPLLITFCQGFPATQVYPRESFVGLRFTVRVGNQSDFKKEQIQKWKTSLIFLQRALIPCRWMVARIGGGILLHVNLPLYTDAEGSLRALDYQLSDIDKHPIQKKVDMEIFYWDKFAECLSKDIQGTVSFKYPGSPTS